jgi:hypothetical protein
VFLNFFAGLAFDTLARTMPSRSPLLPGTLDDAERFFLQAEQVPPAALIRRECKALSPISEQFEEGIVLNDPEDENSPRNSLNSQFSTTAPSTAATSVSGYHDESSSSCESSPAKRSSPVSPLFIRKYTTLPQTPSKGLVDSTSLISLPTSTPRSSSKPSAFNFLKLQSLATKDDESLEPDYTSTYNETINSFTTMISNHMTSLQQFRKSTEVAHEVRRPTSRDGIGSKEMGPEEKLERIVRGRESGWRRERFNPRRYEELCEVALAEL